MNKEQRQIESFLARYRGASRATREMSMRRFRGWCDERGIKLKRVRRGDIQAYVDHLHDAGLKPSTIYSYVGAVCIFYRIAEADGFIRENPAVLVKRPTVRYDSNRLSGLSQHDVEKLILHAGSISPAHVAIVACLAMLGLRASEAAAIRIEDFAGYKNGHRVMSIVGKGGKPATIPLPPLVFSILDKCAANRTGPLFVSRSGRQLTRNDIYKRIRVLGQNAGLSKIHPHQLRHSAVTAALDAGATYREVQQFGRWSDPRMVEVYDRNRGSLDRHANYKLAAHLSRIAQAVS